MSRTFLCADLFCGAGGTSTGATRALRRAGHTLELVAVNHWDKAIATHSANHPRARHYCVNLDTSSPEEIVPEGYLDLLMASPECVHHSRARGGKPVSDQRRADAWMVNRWLTRLDVAAILIENVPEFVEWGPTDQTGKPIPGKKRLYFEAWVQSLWALGYSVDWRILNAADYGDATTRRRFFLIARKDGVNVRWPTATHSRQGSGDMFGGLKRWRPAREVIDMAHHGQSIFDRKTPLSVNTRLRIARGAREFWGALAPHYIRLLKLPVEDAAKFDLGEGDGEPQPFLINQRDSWDGKAHVPGRVRTLDESLFTVTGSSRPGLVNPTAQPFTLANRNNNTARSPDEPIAGLTTAHGGGLQYVEPTVEPVVLGQHGGSVARLIDAPLPTIATDGAIAVVEPVIDRYYGAKNGKPRTPSPVDDPLPTITVEPRFGLVDPIVTPYYGNSQAASIHEPLSTVTGRARHGLVEPMTVPYGPAAESRSVDQPLHTITTRDRLAVAMPMVVPFITANFGERAGQPPRVHPIDGPLPTVTSRGAGNLIEPVLEHAAPEVDPDRLVWIWDTDRESYVLHALDIRYRMLKNRELARAMSFDDDGVYDFVGTQAEVTMQIGNAVPCRTAEALVRTILLDGGAVEVDAA